jgi:hypothetical protein
MNDEHTDDLEAVEAILKNSESIAQPKLFYIVSVKHTHPRDNWFTLHRTSARGYTIFKQNIGAFPEHDTINQVAEIEHGNIWVPADIADLYFKKVRYEGLICEMLPNNEETRAKFGITPAQCQEKYRYKFSPVKIL